MDACEAKYGEEVACLRPPLCGGVGGRPVDGRMTFEESKVAFSRGFLNIAVQYPQNSLYCSAEPRGLLVL